MIASSKKQQSILPSPAHVPAACGGRRSTRWRTASTGSIPRSSIRQPVARWEPKPDQRAPDAPDRYSSTRQPGKWAISRFSRSTVRRSSGSTWRCRSASVSAVAMASRSRARHSVSRTRQAPSAETSASIARPSALVHLDAGQRRRDSEAGEECRHHAQVGAARHGSGRAARSRSAIRAVSC
jgi:hypothetical protein